MTKPYVFPTDLVDTVNEDYAKLKDQHNDIQSLETDLQESFVTDIIDDFIESQTKVGIIVANNRLYVNIRQPEGDKPVWVCLAEAQEIADQNDPFDDDFFDARGVLITTPNMTWNGTLAQSFMIKADISSEGFGELLQGTIEAWKPSK